MSETAQETKFCLKCGERLALRVIDNEPRMACACGFVLFENPTPVVAAVIEHPDGVLLVRGKGFPPGWYGMVTGFVERCEHPEQAVLREVEEELGLSGKIAAFIGHYIFEPRNQLVIAYHIEADGPVVLSDELEAFKAVPRSELKPSSLAPTLQDGQWPFGAGQAISDWLERFPNKR
jgi:NAD+ diphosphatase